jgi:alcohol dehydrogenase YqhD (iron-dependent ADH family)
MSAPDDVEKLKILLPHWIEHNQEHAQEFRNWAERVGKCQPDLSAAAEHLDQASQALRAAWQRLGGGTP